MSDSSASVLLDMLPTRAALDALLAGDARRRECVPLAGDRLAAPFEIDWRDGFVDTATFEIYEQDTPLGPVSAQLYRSFLQLPAAHGTRRLVLGNVACRELEDAWLLGDPIELLVREGLPAELACLKFTRWGPVSNAGDLGYCPIGSLAPLLDSLGELLELELTGCEQLGVLRLPRLRSLRLQADVSAHNLTELARAELPALALLELQCDEFSAPAQRFHAVRALLSATGMPRLSQLVLDNLDLDEERRLELDDGESGPGPGPDAWIEMIATSPLLPQLRRLELSFREDEVQLPRLLDHVDAFRHLELLEFWGARGRTQLEFPTRADLHKALGR